MATNPKSFSNASLLTTSLASYYAVPASTTATIKQWTVINTSASAVVVTLHIIDSGDSADASNKFEFTLAGGEPRVIHEYINANLEALTDIQMKADTASVINLRMSGIHTV